MRRYAPLLLLAVVWEAVSRLGIVPTAALPPLDQVASAWLNLAEGGDLWTNGVFAGIVEIAVGGLCLVKGIAVLRRRLLIWHQEVQEPTTV